jgi:uncharacterized protein YdeI (YjbR/CyaY-like superfamily)
MKPTFFRSAAEFRSWLKQHHAKAAELHVGFHKRKSGKPSITWPEAVDQALCYGWIDGLRRSIDDTSYVIRFTPRRPGSVWSTVNVQRVKELDRLGKMRAAGLKAFKALKTSKVYSYEQRHTAALSRADERMFRADKKAWTFFQDQAPWYRRMAIWWIVSAKKQATRHRRLAKLMECSRQRQIIPPMGKPRLKGKAP